MGLAAVEPVRGEDYTIVQKRRLRAPENPASVCLSMCLRIFILALPAGVLYGCGNNDERGSDRGPAVREWTPTIHKSCLRVKHDLCIVNVAVFSLFGAQHLLLTLLFRLKDLQAQRSLGSNTFGLKPLHTFQAAPLRAFLVGVGGVGDARVGASSWPLLGNRTYG